MMSQENREELGRRLKQARDDKGLKRTDVAKAWGCDPSNVAHVEAGRQNLSVPQILAFAALAGIEASHLLDGLAVKDEEQAPGGEAV